MKKFLLILLAIFLLIIASFGFMFYRSFDEEAYKAQIIASTKELTGRDMVINGQFSLEIFPSPVIRISDVVVKNKKGFDEDFLKIKSVEARIRFASLFKNPLIVDNIVLKNPEFVLQRNDKGENNWNLTFLTAKDKTIIQDDLIGKTFADLPPQFQNIQLENGKISYFNLQTEQKVVFTDINGKINSTSIDGPFDFVGKIKYGQLALDTTLHVDKLNLQSQTKFTLSLLNPDSKSVLSIQKGLLEKLAQIDQSISGGFTFNIPKVSSFLAASVNFRDLPEALNQSFIGNGQFNITAKEISLTDIATRFGEDNIENAMASNITILQPTKMGDKPKVSALVRFSKLNLDTFYPYIPKATSWQNILISLKNLFPENLDFILGASQVQLYEQLIKDFVLSFDINNQTARIREFKAILPEKTTFSADADILLNVKEPSIQANYALETKDPTTTLKWLNLANKLSFDISHIKDLNVSGQMRLKPNDLTFSKIDTKINNGKLNGGLVFSLTEPKLTGYANLDIDNVNFDEFFTYKMPEANQDLSNVLKDIKRSLSDSVLLNDINFAIKMTGKNITFKNLPMQQVSYDGKIEDRNWTTNDLTITQAAMSNIVYKGSIQKLADNSLYFKDVLLDLEMPKSLLLLDRLKINSPLPGNISKVKLKLNLNGSFDKMETSGEIIFSQGRIGIQGNIEKLLTNSQNYALLLKISHPNFHQFMRLFNPSFKMLPNLSGNFAFNGTVKGSETQLSLIKSELVIGAQKINGDINFIKNEDEIQANGKLSSPYLFLDKFLTSKNIMNSSNTQTGKSHFSEKLLNFDMLEDLALDIDLNAEKVALGKIEMGLFSSRILLNDKILMLNDTKASVNGGGLEMSSVLNCSTATPFLKGSVKMDKVPVRADLITLGLFRIKNGTTSLMLNFDTKGNSIDDMMNSLSSTGRFAIQNGAISSLNLNAFERRIKTSLARQDTLTGMTNQLNKELTVGETSFDSLEGSFAVTNGIFRTSDTILRTPNANAILQINFDIPDWTINASAAITMQSFTGYPPISAVVKGIAYNPQTNIDLSSFIRYIETASTDAKEKLLQEEKAAKAVQARMEAKDRITALAEILAQAEHEIAKTEQVLSTVNLQSAQREFVRAKDALVLLRELAKKQAPSVADIEKASAQSALITSRTQTILNEAAQQALSSFRKDIQEIETQAQEIMHAVHRVWQRLNGVEQIDQAYQKAFSTMSLIQQLKSFADTSKDVSKLQIAIQQAKDALDIIDLTYESIAKFDIEAITEPTEQTTEQMQGFIRRN